MSPAQKSGLDPTPTPRPRFIALFEELHSSLSPALKARLALPLGQIQPSSLPTLCSLIWLHLCLHPASDRTLPPAADPRLQLTPHPDSCPREIQVEFRAEAAPPSTHNYNQDLKSDPFSSLSPISPAPRWSHSLPRYNVDSKTNISKPVSDCPLTGWPGTKAALSVLNDLPQNPPTPQTHPPCFPHLFLPQFPFCASFSLLFFLFDCRWDPQKVRLKGGWAGTGLWCVRGGMASWLKVMAEPRKGSLPGDPFPSLKAQTKCFCCLQSPWSV